MRAKSTISTIDALLVGMFSACLIAVLIMYAVLHAQNVEIQTRLDYFERRLEHVKVNQDSIISGLRFYREEVAGWTK